jgi:hypothetical protein
MGGGDVEFSESVRVCESDRSDVLSGDTRGKYYFSGKCYYEIVFQKTRNEEVVKVIVCRTF